MKLIAAGGATLHVGNAGMGVQAVTPGKWGRSRTWVARGWAEPVASAVEAWARENASLRVALCGHRGDYDLPGWEVLEWSRGRLTYGGNNTTDAEAIWFSPACLRGRKQFSLFGAAASPEGKQR